MSGELPGDVNPYQIEPQLSAYAPRPPRIDRDRLMFEAGRAAAASHPASSAARALRPGVIAWFPPSPSAAPANWLWPVCTAGMTVIAVSLGLALLLRPAPLERVQVVERVVHIPPPLPQAAPKPTLAVTSGGLNHAGQDLRHQPATAQETPVVTLADLPANHMLRVRHVAFSEGVESLSPPAGSHFSRLSPPPTRGSLMRKLASPPAAAAVVPTSPLSRWSDWLVGKPKPSL